MVLDHVADVEEGGFLAGPFVGFADAEVAVLYGHAVAAKGHHFGAVGDVQVVEGGFAEVLVVVEGRCWGDAIGQVSSLRVWNVLGPKCVA